MHLLLALLGIVVAAVFLLVGVGAAINVVDQGQPVRPSRAGASRIFREVAAHLLTGLMLPLGAPQARARAAELPDTVPDRVPVVLVPGYALNRACFTFLAMFLRRRGWRWVWAINNRPNSSPIPVFARNLAQRVDELRRVTGAEMVDSIGHSMGGVIAAWYINRMDGAPTVRRLITLGTPWLGTRMHVWGRRREARDLTPGCEIIADIAHPRVPTTAIWSRSDQLVIPAEGARGEGTEAVELVQVGHLEMLYSARVSHLVAETLEARTDPPAEPPPPAPADFQ